MLLVEGDDVADGEERGVADHEEAPVDFDLAVFHLSFGAVVDRGGGAHVRER